MLGKFIKFAVVGASGFVVDFSITALLSGVLGISMVLATGVGFCFGATSNYFLNRMWTWRSKNPNVRAEYIKFFIVSLAGLGLHYLIFLGAMSLLTGGLDVMGYTLSVEWLSKIIATGVVMFWNFGANNFYTFKGTSK